MCFLLTFSIFTYFVPLAVKSSTAISQNVIPEDPIISSGKDTGVDARPLLQHSFVENIQDLNDNENNAVAFKALNGLAPEYLSDFCIRIS